MNAEEQAATLQRQRVIEEKKMMELEKIREQLERLLVMSSKPAFVMCRVKLPNSW